MPPLSNGETSKAEHRVPKAPWKSGPSGPRYRSMEEGFSPCVCPGILTKSVKIYNEPDNPALKGM